MAEVPYSQSVKDFLVSLEKEGIMDMGGKVILPGI